jgi:hypothetical protein
MNLNRDISMKIAVDVGISMLLLWKLNVLKALALARLALI